MKKLRILIRMLFKKDVFLAYIKDNQPYIYANSNITALKVYSALGNNQKRKHGRFTKKNRQREKEQ